MRISGPASEGRSTPFLLLNPPSGAGFTTPFVIPWVRECSPLFPPHVLHLDLTFWIEFVLLFIIPSQDKLTTVVYRLNKLGEVRLNGGYRFKNRLL